MIRLKRCWACAGLVLIQGYKPSADVPPIEVRGCNLIHKKQAHTHTHIVTVSIIANWLFAQWREKLVSTKGSCLGWSVVSSDARLEFHVVWRLSVPQSCRTIAMFVQWYDVHGAAVATGRHEQQSETRTPISIFRFTYIFAQHVSNNVDSLSGQMKSLSLSQCTCFVKQA